MITGRFLSARSSPWITHGSSMLAPCTQPTMSFEPMSSVTSATCPRRRWLHRRRRSPAGRAWLESTRPTRAAPHLVHSCTMAITAASPETHAAPPAVATPHDHDLHDNPLIGEAPPSPAGPLETPEPIAMPPARKQPRFLQTIRFGQRPLSYHLG